MSMGCLLRVGLIIFTLALYKRGNSELCTIPNNTDQWSGDINTFCKEIVPEIVYWFEWSNPPDKWKWKEVCMLKTAHVLKKVSCDENCKMDCVNTN